MNDEYFEERLESAFGCSPPKQALNDLKEYTPNINYKCIIEVTLMVGRY